tara:strand:+ start:1114 stop:1437 length:324 start_codon:yes stop_codon:yes gene_type:complete
MTYIVLYFFAIASIWWIASVGWMEALKRIISIAIPSILIILFNVKTGRFLFRNPTLGIISILPTAIFIFKSSQPLVGLVNNWIDKNNNNYVYSKDVVDTEVISKEDA